MIFIRWNLKLSTYNFCPTSFPAILIFVIIISARVDCLSAQDTVSDAENTMYFVNPVIPGDHSDCTLTRVGNDFYSTGSSFNPTPVIYHSTDLVHWEAIAQPVSAAWTSYGDKVAGGCWGGQIVFYNNKYWDFFSCWGMHFVTADVPSGPWSTPVRMNKPASLPFDLGADNSIFIDDNGKWYLVIKNGQPNNAIVELGPDGQPNGNFYNLAWLNPASENYPYSWAEGPVIWKAHGYYYYSFARDVGGGQKVIRSKSLTDERASWTEPVDLFNENDPGKATAVFSGPNHNSAVVILDDSTSWLLHPVWARANGNEWFGQGRQGLLNQVRYDSLFNVVADYPVNATKPAPLLPTGGIPWMVPKSDFFNNEKMNPEWSFIGYTPTGLTSLTARPGWLRIKPKSSIKSNTVTKTDPEHNYCLITRLDFDPGAVSDEAGIRIMNGLENQFAKICSSVNPVGHPVVRFSFNKNVWESENYNGHTLWLKMVRVNHMLSGYYSADGIEWKRVGKNINITTLDGQQADFNGWCGNRQGLYVSGKSADFDLYIYRDAYTPIPAEMPANRYGTVRLLQSANQYVLDSISNKDWALYAGVEFGSNDYPKASDSVYITASCATGGVGAEIWLDSILTGTKIASCTIENTGGFGTFKRFSAKTLTTTGRHDMFIRFTGPENQRLLVFKEISFSPLLNPLLKEAYIQNDTTIEIRLTVPVADFTGSQEFEVRKNGATALSVNRAFRSAEDSGIIVLNLSEPAKNTDTVTVSLIISNIFSPDGLQLVPFKDHTALNLIRGSAPVLISTATNRGGDTLSVHFSKAMTSPADPVQTFSLLVNGDHSVSMISVFPDPDDSTVLLMVPASRVYYEDALLFSCTGNSVLSADSGRLAAFQNIQITNLSTGYPPVLKEVFIRKTGTVQNILILKFNRVLTDVSTQRLFFSVTVNGNPAIIRLISGSSDSIRLTISPGITANDQVLLNYSGGKISTPYGGLLAPFKGFLVNGTPVSERDGESFLLPGEKLRLYPNPASDQLQIRSAVEFTSISILDVLGRQVYHANLPDRQSSLSLNLSLSKGVYLIRVSNSEAGVTARLIVE
jgi:xylan 1,4-beta-xylosidase